MYCFPFSKVKLPYEPVCPSVSLSSFQISLLMIHRENTSNKPIFSLPYRSAEAERSL